MLLKVDELPELRTYLLMEKISPYVVQGYQVRNARLSKGRTVSELGLFSSIFTRLEVGKRNENTVLHEEVLGLLFRTKTTDKDEGGISSGAAVLDYPFLVPYELMRAKEKELGEIASVVRI